MKIVWGCQVLVPWSCLTLCDPVEHSPPVSSVHGASSGKNTGVGCHFFLQGVFPIQGLNPGLPDSLLSEPPGKPLWECQDISSNIKHKLPYLFLSTVRKRPPEDLGLGKKHIIHTDVLLQTTQQISYNQSMKRLSSWSRPQFCHLDLLNYSADPKKLRGSGTGSCGKSKRQTHI